jgi:dTDP-4-amino-4,6-dideoxygalactose transaminase
LPITSQKINKNSLSSYHLFVIRIDKNDINLSHKDLYLEMKKAGIGVNLHYIPIYRHPYYEKLGFLPGYCPEAEKYFQDAITIPLYPDLTQNEQEFIIDTLHKIIS